MRGCRIYGMHSHLRDVSRTERSHCPTQTVKKLLEEQRRRQQQPEAGGVPGHFSPPLAQPLTPSVKEAEAGHTHFPTFEETVDSRPGNLAPPPSGFPDWDPSTHAAYTDSSYSAAEGFLTPDFYPPSDPGRSGPFPLGMEDSLDTRLYPEPSLPQVGAWRVSSIPSGSPQLPPSTGPSLETARAHILALGPQQLLAQDEEGDTLLHLFAARGLRWAAYAAAEVLQMYQQLDIREHKGKVRARSPDFSTRGRGHLTFRGEDSGSPAAANQPLIVEDLLSLAPSLFCFAGLTPLHTATLALNAAMPLPSVCPRMLSPQARDRLACVQMLLQMGASHTSQEIKSNKTILHLAVQAANPTLVQLLLGLPRGDLRAFVNMKAHGNTALHMAAALPPGPPQEAIVRHLLAAGADPTLRNLENEQPVHLLRPGPGPEGLRQLLKRSRAAPPGLSS
ncbi:NF-kappa-B inhibitor delta [Lemmus lemmus]